MIDYVIQVTAAIAALCAGYMIRSLVRNPRNPALWGAVLAMVFLVLGILLGVAGFGAQRNVPLHPLDWCVSVASHVATMTGGYMAVLLFLFSINERATAWRKARRHGLVLLCAVVLAVGFASLAPPMDYTEGFSARYAHAPWTSAYIMVFTLYLSTAVGTIAVLSWRWSRLSTEPWIRRGMVVGGIGDSIAVVYCCFKVAYIGTSVISGAVLFKEGDVTAWLIGAALPMGLIGLTVPGWGPALSALGRWLRRHRAHRALHPLWHALTEPFPHVRMGLDPSRFSEWLDRRFPGNRLARRLGTAWNERWAPHWADMDLRLHLRVVQIWDARRALLDHCDPAVYQRALPGGPDRAEAEMLAGALRLLRAGDPPPLGDRSAIPTGSDSTDLAENVRWLRRISRRYRALTPA
ncbi:MAB_1171c family putative transporter [Kutzneria albida]|uniref:Putative membrane protein n=1 Tax=Kutzneria albida DSM 43870 TaxID=1449976 RepID=W5VYL9_9PSEU|nr:MAB_1171c family putative transporter [Kutzneria albida]AHH93540.1 putative membrane protein [Kutzneria albida DSM 43870]